MKRTKKGKKNLPLPPQLKRTKQVGNQFRRTKTKPIKQNSPYKGDRVRLVQHWNKHSESNIIPLNTILVIKNPPKGKKQDFRKVWVKWKGVKLQLLLSEVNFVRTIAVSNQFVRTK